jgi:hypothetical protein
VRDGSQIAVDVVHARDPDERVAAVRLDVDPDLPRPVEKEVGRAVVDVEVVRDEGERRRHQLLVTGHEVAVVPVCRVGPDERPAGDDQCEREERGHHADGDQHDAAGRHEADRIVRVRDAF